MSRLIELFEGEGNRLSMARLTIFASFFPASYVLIATQSETIFGWYVSAYVFGYVGGKGVGLIGGRKNARRSVR